MEPIRMVDLKGQYNKIKSEIDNAIFKIIDETSFVKGEDVKQFESQLAKYINAKHIISCANGTDALQVAMMALNLKPGDEVITADFTFIATAEVIALMNLTPVLVDVDPDTFIITPEAIEKAITPRTKAIVPVHLFGQCANMEEIMVIAKKHNLFVVEDVAQANGCVYTFKNGKKQSAGTIGHVGCTSFFPSKNLGCFGDGGALITNDNELAKKISSIANHGMTKRYYHDNIGVNSRLDTIQAAILSVKLNYLKQYNDARNKAAEFYDKELAGISWVNLPKRVTWSDHIFHQYTVIVDNGSRDKLKMYLNEKGIPSMIYYPVPIHSQVAYAQYGFKNEDFPVTNMLSEKVLSLPMHTELADEQLRYITESIKNFKS
jgi:UDP-2-acetamido-2-deoxy-ribo-hexuluronate aminotransferase